MAGFQEDKARAALSLASHEAPVVMVAVGYEGKIEDADSFIQEKEKRPRTRKSIRDVVTIIGS